MTSRLLAFNRWANNIIGNFIIEHADKVDKEIISSFPSIRKTLYHMWDAQVIWIRRLNGASLSDWPSKNFTGSIEDAVHGLLQSSDDLIQYEKNLNGDLEKIIDYKSVKGDPFSSTIEDILTHVVNHGTYHRGQLITMLRQAGAEKLGSTDFIAYTRIEPK